MTSREEEKMKKNYKDSKSKIKQENMTNYSQS